MSIFTLYEVKKAFKGNEIELDFNLMAAPQVGD